MTLHTSPGVEPAGNDRASAPGLLITTDRTGQIMRSVGHWPGGGVSHARVISELVHDRNHDLLQLVLDWVATVGSLDRGVGVQVDVGGGNVDALVTATAVSDGIVWSFLPALADPLRATVAAVTDERDLATVLDVVLSVVAEAGPALWATVHYDLGVHGRYREVVSSTGRDTFRRAVESAVAGDDGCPWDTELHEERRPVPMDVFGDGIKLAGPHAGIGACQLISIPASSGRDAACLAVWSETAAQLEAPDQMLLVRRVVSAATLAFQIEARRDGLRKLATRDGLTGLWNRPAFMAQLKAPPAQHQCAVLFADIDDFSALNDWHGYGAGDEVLLELGRRLRNVMRPGDVIARVSADEFAVLCANVLSDEAGTTIAERLIDVCHQPFHVGGEQVDVNVSVGLALAQPDRTGQQLFVAAERAMLEAKESTGCTWRLA